MTSDIHYSSKTLAIIQQRTLILRSGHYVMLEMDMALYKPIHSTYYSRYISLHTSICHLIHVSLMQWCSESKTSRIVTVKVWINLRLRCWQKRNSRLMPILIKYLAKYMKDHSKNLVLFDKYWSFLMKYRHEAW